MSRPVYLDTNVLIAFLELEDSVAAETILNAINRSVFVGLTSELTLAEVLAKPIEMADDALEQAYIELFDGRLFKVAPISRSILVQAAQLRASDKSLKLPDAIHLATAFSEGCRCVLTDDLRLNLPAGMTRVRLTDTALDEVRQFFS